VNCTSTGLRNPALRMQLAQAESAGLVLFRSLIYPCQNLVVAIANAKEQRKNGNSAVALT
jgi:hypothetical protein